MIVAFIGISAALYGGMILAGVVTAFHRPLMWLVLTGEHLNKYHLYGGATGAAVIIGAGYSALVHGLAGVS